jgi:hypothetical protein
MFHRSMLQRTTLPDLTITTHRAKKTAFIVIVTMKAALIATRFGKQI